MKNILQRLKAISLSIFLWAIVFLIAWGYWQLSVRSSRSERGVIYIKAKQLAAQQQRERLQAYQKRMQEQRLRRQYQQGKVVGRMPSR